MDWKSLKDRAKSYADRGVRYAAESAAKTPVVMRTEDDRTKFLWAKKSVLIAGEQDDETYRLAVLRFPELATKAWIESAMLRYLDRGATPELAKGFGVETVPVAILLKNGEEIKRHTGTDEVRAFFSDFSF